MGNEVVELKLEVDHEAVEKHFTSVKEAKEYIDTLPLSAFDAEDTEATTRLLGIGGPNAKEIADYVSHLKHKN